jgi:membrane fusion protein (multidrug efflux system)
MTTFDEERMRRLRGRLFAAFSFLIVAGAVAGGLWWWLVASHYVSTENAYVEVSAAQITALSAGRVQSVPVHDTMRVRRGDVLVVIDPANAKIAVEKAKAAYEQTMRKVQAEFGSADTAAAQVEARQADFERAKLDYERRKDLVESGAVSREELSAVKNNVLTASAGLEAANGQFRAATALVAGSGIQDNPEVLAAKAALDDALLNLERTTVRAPLDGVVAQRDVQIGQMVAVGAPLMAVVPVDEVYVDANFKESEIGRMRPGQEVTLTSDMYGSSVVFHGRLSGLAGGTGASFAVIPAQNATGNWIKVVQRVPVRILLDKAELRDHPLRVGLSMTVKVKVVE